MSEPLLRVRNLVKTFEGRRVLDDVSFDMMPGEVLGLVGESGSGKSTTARCVARLTEPDSGRVELGGRDVLAAGRKELRSFRREMQMVFQDPYSSLNPRMTVAELLEEPLAVHGLEPDRRRRRDRAAALLETVSMSAEHLDRYPRSFSGGQRQRIAIARALAVEPRLLICDEPISSLDVSVQAQVLNLLRDLRRRLNLSILFIAHDLAVVYYLCDRIAVMEQGRLAEIGTREQVYEAPEHPYTRSLLAAVPIPDPAAERARRAAEPQD
ncbi:ATP-binding cassette domain-containing protein [Streptosporangium sp. NBC_01639]|uniref:ATP-binding cassette domain-containing protein n=1 Tax=unclassified Streptosporangium TaxID=2632669 RepID=UPI002DD934F8|nr:ATP-binding cassette domain-containing protein [Streptosporangium sp. NBC_01756]WSC84632.1 ATP-binding cassette domain-containing protein [Streptosporangium sp. NBC_01756]WTD56736.1 ATP-binding cassette domain-containing protein [Streptosporangium sp. NBC_01639]